MSPLALRRRMARSRGSLAAVACVLALSGAVAAHHTEMPDHADMGMHGVATMVMCLGIVGLVVVAVAAAPKLGRVLPWMRRTASERTPQTATGRTAHHAARDGPPLFLLFAVVRR